MTDQILRKEIHVLIDAIVNAAENHVDRQDKSTFEYGLELSSECIKHRVEIAKELVLSFPRADLQAVIDVDVQERSLNVSVSCLSPYVSTVAEGAWDVYIPFENSWRFGTKDESSARHLAVYLNTAPHARNVRALNPKSGLDVDSLGLWMRDLESKGISVSSVEYKKT